MCQLSLLLLILFIFLLHFFTHELYLTYIYMKMENKCKFCMMSLQFLLYFNLYLLTVCCARDYVGGVLLFYYNVYPWMKESKVNFIFQTSFVAHFTHTVHTVECSKSMIFSNYSMPLFFNLLTLSTIFSVKVCVVSLLQYRIKKNYKTNLQTSLTFYKNPLIFFFDFFK